MAASSLAHLFTSSPPPPPRKTLNPNKALTISSASLLPSPKPRIHRRNHLRPKIPLPSKPHLGPKEEEAVAVVAVEVEEEKEEESVQELTFEPSQSPAPLPNPNPSSKSAVLDLSLRFAALLAVQTAAAVWLYSRGGGNGGLRPEEESTKLYDGVVVKDVGKIGEQKIESDFDRVVLEIREMAREARETEAKEREENELKKERFLKGVVGGSRVLEKDLGGGKSWSRKRLGFVRTNVARRKNVGKGFNGLEKVEEEEDNASENGGIRQIGHQNPPRESLSVHESRQLSVLSEMNENTAATGVFDTPLTTIERSEMDHATSLVNGKSTEKKIQAKQSIGEGEIPSSRKCRNINGRSESPVQKKEAVGKRVVNKNKGGMLDHGKKPWWLKLPYVHAILLSRGSDRSYPKGLYSLKMDSPSGKEGSEYYTILFQDQGNATNFCYLLESFFEEWDDFSADVVPLVIHELEEAVRSSELKVIVVKKGQLQLYAGQPLSDVESALRSLLLTREK